MGVIKKTIPTEDEIVATFRDGHAVYWRNAKSRVMRTNSGHFNVETATGNGRYIMNHLPKLVRKFGVKDFYYLEDTTMAAYNIVNQLRELKNASAIGIAKVKATTEVPALGDTVPLAKVQQYLEHQRCINERIGLAVAALAKIVKAE